MSTREHLHGLVASLQPVVQGVPSASLDAATPCEEWDVRRLASHLLGTTEAMRRVGAGEPLDRDDPWGTSGQELGETWRDQLSDRLIAVADAWAQPEAWDGEALDGAMGRKDVGDMAFLEVLLHGWDLARATGQQLEVDDAVAERAGELLAEHGETGRSMGAFGPEVEAGEDPSPLDRALAASGRDPRWGR